MANILLHKELGVNARLTFCPQCGKDGNELVLLGLYNYRQQCNSCGAWVYGGVRFSAPCPKCGSNSGGEKKYLTDYEKVPGSLCDDCQKKNAEVDAEVERGGVYWRCRDCGSAGAIKADAEFSKRVREAHKMPTGKCGVEFDKRDCPVCSK